VKEFTTHHASRIVGVLEGFDRLLFRGTLRSLGHTDGMMKFLNANDILLKDFGAAARRWTDRLAKHAQAVAEAAGRPYQYLQSPTVSKEEVAVGIAQRDGVTEGLVCVLACVEPCMTYDVQRNRALKRLVLVRRRRQCRYFYFYFMHREFGLMHVRLQSWLPFEVQVCINGRSYLQRQLDRAGIGYEKRDNGFARIDNLRRAQKIMDRLTHRHWQGILNRIVMPLMPLLGRRGELGDERAYYWSIRQSEYATDVMFKDAATLAEVYEPLCRHAIERLSSADVLRFLGKRLTAHSTREVTTDLKRRVEGMRIKHRAGANSIKMYDKQGSILRIETTINDAAMFRVWRTAQGDDRSRPDWRRLRQGVADTARRVEVSRAANHRYLQALSAVADESPTHRVLDPISRPVRYRGRSYRALRPISPEDAAFLAAVLDGGHLVDGFTNRDLQRRLFPKPPRDETQRRRRSGAISRKLRLLRRHGLIHKVNRRRLYRITPKGHRVMTMSTLLRQATPVRLAA
jgi:hypothetical protein